MPLKSRKPKKCFITCEICGYRSIRTNQNKRKFMAKFPLDEQRCKQWVKVVGKEDLVYVPIEKLNSLKYVCGDHFEKRHFNKKNNRLRKTAVPVKNLKCDPLPDEMLEEFPLHVCSEDNGVTKLLHKLIDENPSLVQVKAIRIGGSSNSDFVHHDHKYPQTAKHNDHNYCKTEESDDNYPHLRRSHRTKAPQKPYTVAEGKASDKHVVDTYEKKLMEDVITLEEPPPVPPHLPICTYRTKAPKSSKPYYYIVAKKNTVAEGNALDKHVAETYEKKWMEDVITLEKPPPVSLVDAEDTPHDTSCHWIDEEMLEESPLESLSPAPSADATPHDTQTELPAPGVFSWQRHSCAVPTDCGDDVQSLAEHEGDMELTMFDTESEYKPGENRLLHKSAVDDTNTHDGFQCNGCHGDIIGFRYTCVQCEDYDLCALCEARREHPSHYVLRVPAPRPYNEIQTVLQTIRRALLSDSIVHVAGTRPTGFLETEVKEEDEAPDPIPVEAEWLHPDIEESNTDIDESHADIEGSQTDIEERQTDIAEIDTDIEGSQTDIEERQTDIEERHTDIEERHMDINDRSSDITEEYDSLKEELLEEYLDSEEEHTETRQKCTKQSNLDVRVRNVPRRDISDRLHTYSRRPTLGQLNQGTEDNRSTTSRHAPAQQYNVVPVSTEKVLRLPITELAKGKSSSGKIVMKTYPRVVPFKRPSPKKIIIHRISVAKTPGVTVVKTPCLNISGTKEITTPAGNILRIRKDETDLNILEMREDNQTLGPNILRKTQAETGPDILGVIEDTRPEMGTKDTPEASRTSQLVMRSARASTLPLHTPTARVILQRLDVTQLGNDAHSCPPDKNENR